jgi:hypothetical protein
MPILVIVVGRALWALRRDRGVVSLGLLVLIAFGGGGVFYWLVEDLSPLNALYLSALTLTTVGYGEPAPETAAGKVFTMPFAVFGMGLLLGFLAIFASQVRRQSVLRHPLEKVAKHREEPHRPAGDVRSAEALSGVGEYDLLVIGSDEASHRTALEAAQAGLRVVLVEPGRLAELTESADPTEPSRRAA